ncbi:MAG: tryptophan--tRNA ligase [Pseudomonadota bacterium]
MSSKRILSGMQPTNALHVGNYLGALKNWVALQDQPGVECLFCVVDLHAITVPYDRAMLAANTREIAAAYIAAGIDVRKSAIFAQSSVKQHAEAMWLLATMTQIGKLDRMTQFKDKASKNAEKAGLGLYAYPVLMAADIMIYKATDVPVGDDQKQHVELARDIAGTFNHRYGVDFFPEPRPLIMGETTRVMSLRDGTQKMSKSAESDMSRINLADTPDMIADKIKRAKSDADVLPSEVAGLAGRSEAENLVAMYASLAGMTKADVLREYGGQGFGVFKPALADMTVSVLAPISARLRELLTDHQTELDKILHEGQKKAEAIAKPVVEEMLDIMGFWR